MIYGCRCSGLEWSYCWMLLMDGIIGIGSFAIVLTIGPTLV